MTVQARVSAITIRASACAVRHWAAEFNFGGGRWLGVLGRTHLTSGEPLAGVNPTRLDCRALGSIGLKATSLVAGARSRLGASPTQSRVREPLHHAALHAAAGREQLEHH